MLNADASKESVVTKVSDTKIMVPASAPNIKDKIILLGEQSLGLVALLLMGWLYKHVLQPKLAAMKRTISVPLEIDKNINGLLGRILGETRASRVIVAQFHNGQSYYSGYSYGKLTVTHEVVETGVATIGYSMRDLPLSMYAEDLLLTKKSTTGRYTFITSDNLTNSGGKQRMLRNGVDGYYCFILTGTEGENTETRDIGAIFVQYRDIDQVTQIRPQVEELINTIESYLTPESSNKWFEGI